VARTKTDNQGHYTLNVPDEGVPHLVRVGRQSVNYFKQAPPGTATVDLTVYDAATQVEGVAADARVLHLQASSGSLEVDEMYVVKNDSLPPRSKIGNQTFTVTLPEGAQLGEASVTGPGGMPVTVNPAPGGAKNRYAFDFAIRPGETRFDVLYKLPYTGSYAYSFTPETRLNELGVLLPKSMKFTGISAGFAQDTDEGALAVFFAKNLAPNQPVRFSVSGEGLIPRDGQGLGGQPAGDSGGAPAQTSSGGTSTTGLAIGGGVLFLILVGAFILWRKVAAAKAAAADPGSANRFASRVSSPGPKARAQAQTQPAQSDMLEVLKDELFQLETDRMSGKITLEEYEKTKAGLDTLFRRQMKKR
jgi:hypothetical protein